MKHLNRCNLEIGQTLVIGPSFSGDFLKQGETIEIVGFDTTKETVMYNFEFQDITFQKGETVNVSRYLVKVNEKMYPIWPEETVNGSKDVFDLEYSQSSKLYGTAKI